MGPLGLVSPVVAIEDDFLGGAVIAMAERDPEGLIRVTGGLFPSRVDAWAYIRAAIDYPGVLNPSVLVGATLSSDPELEDLTVTPQLRGQAETRRAVSLYRAWLGAGRIIHDAKAPELSRQILDARTAVNASGATLSHRVSRVDLVRAAIWAISEAAQPQSGPVM
jgi:hypothetical protein